MAYPNLINKFYEGLSPSAGLLVERLIKLTDDRNMPIYLVGGPVRDLILGRAPLDLDIVVEGDALSLACTLADEIGGRAVQHAGFGTATVKADRFALDLVTARSETYARPGALPTVRPATMRDDLLRRDFTINAMALRLNGPDRGSLLDPADGRRDIADQLIRVLHEDSFQDDATRILRAFRHAARFDFTIESATLQWLKRDLHYLNSISGARLHREFLRIFAEDAPEKTLVRLDQLGALNAIHPALRFERVHAGAFATLRRMNPTGARASYWPVLGWRLDPPNAASVAKCLALTKPQRAAVAAIHSLQRLDQGLHQPALKPSDLVDMLSPFPLASLWAFAALTGGHVRECCHDYVTKLRHIRPILRGDDVLALGVRSGPQVGEVLRGLKAAKLDAEVKTRKDEEQFVRVRLSSS